MSKTLPKGHVSCLSNTFRYTPALQTNIAQTFARIARELKMRSAPDRGKEGTAWHLVDTGAFHRPQLVRP